MNWRKKWRSASNYRSPAESSLGGATGRRKKENTLLQRRNKNNPHHKLRNGFTNNEVVVKTKRVRVMIFCGLSRILQKYKHLHDQSVALQSKPNLRVRARSFGCRKITRDYTGSPDLPGKWRWNVYRRVHVIHHSWWNEIFFLNVFANQNINNLKTPHWRTASTGSCSRFKFRIKQRLTRAGRRAF